MAAERGERARGPGKPRPHAAVVSTCSTRRSTTCRHHRRRRRRRRRRTRVSAARPWDRRHGVGSSIRSGEENGEGAAGRHLALAVDLLLVRLPPLLPPRPPPPPSSSSPPPPPPPPRGYQDAARRSAAAGRRREVTSGVAAWHCSASISPETKGTRGPLPWTSAGRPGPRFLRFPEEFGSFSGVRYFTSQAPAKKPCTGAGAAAERGRRVGERGGVPTRGRGRGG